jgi:hypothetical protein
MCAQAIRESKHARSQAAVRHHKPLDKIQEHLQQQDAKLSAIESTIEQRFKALDLKHEESMKELKHMLTDLIASRR